jgi:predicted DNA-binding transcriptional regulator YafY
MPENSNRIMLLKMYEILLNETDEEHPISKTELSRRLTKQGVSCHDRTISREFAALNEFGYEVCTYMQGRERYYYVPEHKFSVPELKIMIDAIQAASFVTPKKTKELINKIASLGGAHSAELLKRNMAYFNSHKHSNEAILYNVDAIEAAIGEKKQISFHYFDLNERKRRIFRKGDNGRKKLYNVEPIALIVCEDNYYLMAYSNHHPERTANYRVDRMDQITVIEDSTLSYEALAQLAEITGYTERTFKMFNGELADVVLEFDRSLIGPVLDKFGEEIEILPVDDTTCTASVRVQVAPTFFGWLFQFCQKMRILSPDSVIEEYNKLKEL